MSKSRNTQEVEDPRADDIAKSRLIHDTNYLTYVAKISNRDYKPQSFWKYHVLCIGKDYYLTTNPSTRHLYCRNGPGIYVKVTTRSRGLSNDLGAGYVLTLSTFEPGAPDSRRTTVIIEKQLDSQGGNFKVTIPSIARIQVDGLKSERMQILLMKLTQLYPVYIDPVTKKQFLFVSFLYKDSQDTVWIVGSIPQYKERRLDRAKHAFGHVVHRDTKVRTRLEKYDNIYLYQHTRDKTREFDGPTIPTCDEKVALVAAMFRSCNYSIRNRLSLAASKLVSSVQLVTHGSRSQTTNSSKMIMSSHISSDLGAGSNTRSYFVAQDGISSTTIPVDDCSSSEKLGWITLFDSCIDSNGHVDTQILLYLGLVLAAALNKVNLNLQL